MAKQVSAAVPPAGYHDVKLPSGALVRVADQARPTLNTTSPDGKYDPSDADFGRTSSYAHKTFSDQDTSLETNGEASDLKQKQFLTKSFAASAYDQSDKTFATAAYHSSARSSDDLSKAYNLPPAQTDLTRSFATQPSDLQNKTAAVGGDTSKKDPFSTPWSEGNKQFYDPTILRVPHHHLSGENAPRNAPLDDIDALPNRPLTVDEVRDLINHGQKPDLDSRPDENQSKPLNDPGYEPPLKLPEIDDKAAPATPPRDEAKSDELPSPGMMAAPAK